MVKSNMKEKHWIPSDLLEVKEKLADTNNSQFIWELSIYLIRLSVYKDKYFTLLDIMQTFGAAYSTVMRIYRHINGLPDFKVIDIKKKGENFSQKKIIQIPLEEWGNETSLHKIKIKEKTL